MCTEIETHSLSVPSCVCVYISNLVTYTHTNTYSLSVSLCECAYISNTCIHTMDFKQLNSASYDSTTNAK